MWEQTGAGSSPDALRKMLINRSLRTLGTVLLQVALDTGVHLQTLYNAVLKRVRHAPQQY